MNTLWHKVRLSLCLSLLCLGWSLAVAQASLPDFTGLVEQQRGAVVNISTTQSVTNRLPSIPGLEEGDPMYDLFRRFVPGLPEMPRLGPEGRSLGSGFIISDDGYILTNAHVIEGADEIRVRLADKREFTARVVGTDVRSDVAVIKIDAQALPMVVIGDPERLKPGEWVVAIGSPFGFDQSVTAGIVSAIGRTLPDENFVPFIQTDVAINPGNSGGPLFNLRGEVIGVNSQIYSQTGGFMGLSFAIPIDVAMDIQAQLRSTGQVQRGRIGVAVQELTRSLAESFGLEAAEGALVSGVEPGGPAALAGVEVGDVIVRFNGRAVASSTDLPLIVSAARPGSRVVMEIMRDAEKRSLEITLGEWQDAHAPIARSEPAPAPAANKLGLVLGEPQAPSEGLVVLRTEGVAARADLMQGDRIVAIVLAGRQARLSSLAQFDALISAIEPGQTVTLLIGRGEQTSFLSLQADE